MSEQKLADNMMELGRGIEVCLANRLQRPTLLLLYSAIDIAAWITIDDPNAGVGKRFMAWVDQYLLKAKPLACTAADLYDARCGIVHTLTPESDMSDKGRARLVCYTWGDRKSSDLQSLIVSAHMDDHYVAVQVEELYEAWRLGLHLLIQQLDADGAQAARVNARAAKFFDTGSTQTLDWLIARNKET